MEMDKEKFMEKLKGLQELAKKKKNVLENREVKDYFHDTPLNDQQMEKVYQYLEAHGIDVLRILKMTRMWILFCFSAMTTSIWTMKKKWIWRIWTCRA